MQVEENGIKLSDIIDINLLQEFQDILGKVLNIASITVDEKLVVTKPSSFTDLCFKYANVDSQSVTKCAECDIRWGGVAAETGKPIVYKCRGGLTNFAVPIIVDGKHIGSILGGQVFTEAPNEEEFRRIARKLGIDEDEYISAVRKIKIIPKEHIENIAQLFFIVANAISMLGHKNIELLKKAQNEKLYRNIVETIRETLDINEMKQKIINIVGKTLDADRCFITEYDKAKNAFLIVEEEYVSSDNIEKYLYRNVNVEVPNFVEEIKNGNYLVINNKEIFINGVKQEYEAEREAIEKYGVNSAYAIPLFYQQELLGLLAIHYVREEHNVKTDEIKLLLDIANQIAIALYQSKLYRIMEMNVEREKLIKNIVTKAVSQLNHEDMINNIVTEAGKFFKADRCFFVEYNPKTNSAHPIQEYAQYLSSDRIKSHTGKVFEKGETEVFFDSVKNNIFVCVEDVSKLDLPLPAKQMLVDTYSVKSYLIAPVFYGDIMYGAIVMHYVEDFQHFTEEDLDLAKIVANQSASIIYRAQLFKKAQINAERETVLRKISEMLRSSLDSEQIKKYFMSLMQIYFGADRSLFIDYDIATNRFLPIKLELLKSSDIESVVGIDSEEAFPECCEKFKNGKDVIIKDLEKTLSRTHYTDCKSFESLQKFGVKSDYGHIVNYKGQILGAMILHFIENKKLLTHDEFDFLREIIKQVGIALHQADLYLTIKQQVERESLLRKIYEAIRSSLNIDVIKKTIVTELGKALDADVCLILIYNKDDNAFYIDRNSEYSSLEMAYDFIDMDTKDKKVKWWIDTFLERKPVNFSDADDFIRANNLIGTPEEQFIRTCNVKSGYHMPILYADNLLGYIAIQYINNYRKFNEEELDVIKIITAQAGIALYQANLFDKTKNQAEREKITANLIEILRNTLDKPTIKHLFVRNIGKYIKANRVFFSEFDEANSTFLPVDKNSEYLSGDYEKSFAEYIWKNDSAIREFTQPLLEKKELKILSLDECIEKNQLSYGLISRLQDLDVKSSYNMPVLYQQRIMGYFSIEFTQKPFKISEEDINLIRSICRQAGIALYQAEQYEKAYASSKYNEELIKNLSNEIKTSLGNINELPVILAKCEINCDKEYEYLDILNKNVVKILNMIEPIV